MSLRRAKEVLKIEADAVRSLIPRLNHSFEEAVKALLSVKGRIVVTGMGKPGIIGQKLSATLSSTGSPSLWLHPAEALHGDLGRVTKSDVVVALSNSGETEELVRLLPLIKKIGAKLIAITGSVRSTLAKNSDYVLDVTIRREACPLGLAPTASTTAMLAMGDALAVELQERRRFKADDFAFYHPGGNLAKQLLKVKDLMRTGRANPIVKESATVREALFAITRARAGSASIVNPKGRLVGIFTDGDLRRHLEKEADLSKVPIRSVMTRHPVTISPERLATEALRILEEKRIDEMPVVDASHRPIGLLDVQDLLRVGLVSPSFRDLT
ncbi:MAG: KpsF/GutQ family sugar-phosphate isomerase [Candidatus Omnitrophica bacterium]|nr:KpsF/GutQ family sugar-phosphate isomerase [Candidatus Omnitrophota bacterium]